MIFHFYWRYCVTLLIKKAFTICWCCFQLLQLLKIWRYIWQLTYGNVFLIFLYFRTNNILIIFVGLINFIVLIFRIWTLSAKFRRWKLVLSNFDIFFLLPWWRLRWTFLQVYFHVSFLTFFKKYIGYFKFLFINYSKNKK